MGAGCGGDSTGPQEKPYVQPGISIISGANVTDTIDAPLPQALRMVVRDADGDLMPGVVVRFSSLMIDHPLGGSVPSVLVGDLSDVGMTTFLAETASVNGEAFARIVMGEVA